MHEKQDENSVLSWSTNFFNYNYDTTNIFGNPVAFLGGTMLTDKTKINSVCIYSSEDERFHPK